MSGGSRASWLPTRCRELLRDHEDRRLLTNLSHHSIWPIYFVTSVNEVVVRTLNPFVTSTFALHSLTATSAVFASIIGGVSKLPLAKITDMWGRQQSISITLCLWTLGFVMMAACKNVETYAAALVFSTVGCVVPFWPGLWFRR